MKNFVIPALLAIAAGEASAGEHFACNMKGMSAAERVRYDELTKSILKSVAERVELPDGYGFRLDRSLLPVAAEWVGLEAKCCPFFTFQIQLERKQGPLWLRLTGAEGVKAFIRSELQI